MNYTCQALKGENPSFLFNVGDGATREVELVRQTPSELSVRIGKRQCVYNAVAGSRQGEIHIQGRTFGSATVRCQTRLAFESEAAAEEGNEEGELLSSMPARVLELLVADGNLVEEGQILFVVESMKMQISYKAPRTGTLRLFIESGQLVPAGTVLATVGA